MKYSLIIPSVLFAAHAITSAGDDAEQLGIELKTYLFETYACQKYLGGLTQYDAAKTLALKISTQISGDLKQANTYVDNIEKTILKEKPQIKMETQFNNAGFSRERRVESCKKVIATTWQRLHILQRRLGVL